MKSMSRLILVVPVVLVVLMLACSKPVPPPTPCADLTRGCRIDDGPVEVRVDRMPSALQPFLLTVRAPDANQVHAEFVMQGMEMGLNRYRLVQSPSGEWQGRVTLPVCVSGRRDWLLILEMDGEQHVLAFSTH